MSDPTNKNRAIWAGVAVKTFQSATGGDDDDAQTNLVDLLADLMHWAQQEALDFDEALRFATHHFEEERAEEGAPQ